MRKNGKKDLKIRKRKVLTTFCLLCRFYHSTHQGPLRTRDWGSIHPTCELPTTVRSKMFNERTDADEVVLSFVRARKLEVL